MSFSDNQLIFAAIFFILFVIFISFAYRKDIKKNPDLFKGTWKVVGGIVAVLVLFYTVVHSLG